MPVIVKPEYDDPNLGAGIQNLGTAIFGNATDRADRDLRASRMRNYDAETAVNEQKAARGKIANAAFGRIPYLQRQVVRMPNESDYEYALRTADARGELAQMSADTNFEQYAKGQGTLLGSGYVQSGAAPSMRIGATLMGNNPTAEDAFDAKELERNQAAKLAQHVQPAQIAAAASRYNSDRDYAAQVRGQDVTAGWENRRTDKQYPFQVFKIGNTETGYPIVNGKLDREHPINSTANANAPDVIKSISQSDGAALERRTLQQSYPGLTKQDKKGNLIIDPTFSNSGLAPDAIGRARAAGEAAYKKRGDFGDYAAAYTKEIGHPAGSKYTPVSDPWGPDALNPPRGEWETTASDGPTSFQNMTGAAPAAAPAPAPAAPTGGPSFAPSLISSAVTGQDFRAPTLPNVAPSAGPITSSVFGPQAAAAPAAAPIPAGGKASSKIAQTVAQQPAQTVAPPLAQRTDGMVVNSPKAGPVRWNAKAQGWEPVGRPAATTPTAAPAPNPRGFVTNYATPTESVTVSTTRPSETSPAAGPSASAHKTPVESQIAQAIMKPAAAPVPMQPPASQAFSSEGAAEAALAKDPNDPRALEFLGRVSRTTAPSAQLFTDPSVARGEAANPYADKATQREAQAFNLRSQTPKVAPVKPTAAKTTFRNRKDALDFLRTARRDDPNRQNAQNFIDNQDRGL